ncbi:uncharacterized protein LOC143246765 [Tachypleus tridentatus]|uniref:uncharacterized protein LOC143246765 n=1 Tax=Tachypleus tridentatus TaxID=6853 RepID=UPI003FD0FBC4
MALVRELPISRAFSSVYDVLLLHKANYCYVSFTLISPFGRPMERIATQYMKGDSQVTFQANYSYVSFTLISPFGRPMERIATQYMKGDSQVTFQGNDPSCISLGFPSHLYFCDHI